MSNKQSTLGWLYAVQTGWKFSRFWWKWLLAALGANFISALFEGASIGLFAVGLQILGNPADPAAGSLLLGEKGQAFLADLLARFGRERLFLGMILLAVTSQVLRAVFQFLGVILTAQVRPRVQALATNEIYSRILWLDYQKTSRFRLGDLTDYLQQPVHLNEVFARGNDLVRAVLFLAIYTAILLWISWPMTLMALVLYGVVSRLMGTVLRQVARHAGDVRKSQLWVTQKASESFQALRVLHAFDRREENFRELAERVEQTRKGQAKALIWTSAPEPLTDVLTSVGVAAFILIGYWIQGPGNAHTLTSLLAFLAAMHRVTPSLRTLHAHRVALTNVAPNMARLNELLALEPPEQQAGKPFKGLLRSIDLKDLEICYFEHEAPAVSGLNATFRRGSFNALVGLSGSGKSTVADLLLRLYDPTQGAIQVDDVPLNQIDKGDWLAKVGSVSQDPFLFHSTIRENILFGKPGASEEEVYAAARAAHADTFIRKLADGYDTIVGERGQRLSGGEAQRIALARALVRQPDLLILDEATSALDSDSERLIQLALDEQRGRRTILTIAHRLSTVAHADQILVLSEGRLVEKGTHAELLASGGIYARLWKLQIEKERSAGAPILSEAVLKETPAS